MQTQNLLIIIIPLVIIQLHIEKPQLIHSLWSWNNSQPIPQLYIRPILTRGRGKYALLLEELFREILQVPSTELCPVGNDNNLPFIACNRKIISQIARTAFYLDPVVEEFFKRRWVKDLIVCRGWCIEDILQLNFVSRCVPFGIVFWRRVCLISMESAYCFKQQSDGIGTYCFWSWGHCEFWMLVMELLSAAIGMKSNVCVTVKIGLQKQPWVENRDPISRDERLFKAVNLHKLIFKFRKLLYPVLRARAALTSNMSPCEIWMRRTWNSIDC